MSAINRLQSGYHPKRLRDGTQSRTGMIGGCGVADAPQELAPLVRAIGNDRVLYEYASRGGESHREFLAKVQPKLVAARDEVYAELRREKVQQEIQQHKQQQRGIRRC